MSNYVATNAGKSINTEHTDRFPMILPDGLILFFSSNRPGGQGDLDIYVCIRKSMSEGWSKPINLGSKINSNASDHSVSVSEDSHWMIFTSEKKGGYGGSADLYLSYRRDVSDPLGWSQAKTQEVRSARSQTKILFGQLALFFIKKMVLLVVEQAQVMLT